MDENFFKSKFNWKAYVGKYGDLHKNNIDTEEKAWNHAKKCGRKRKENRDVFNGDQKLLRDFRNFCITGNVKSIPYSKLNIIEKSNKIDMFNLYTLSKDELNKIYSNISIFLDYINKYKNILMICGDYPGYGGAATNCSNIHNFLKTKNHNVFSIYFNYELEKNHVIKEESDYCIINSNEITTKIQKLKTKPDLIILKSPVINIKKVINCPILFFIGGIYKNNLDTYYYSLNTKQDHDKYINKNVLNQIKNSDFSFCNSSHTQEILKQYYNIDTKIFYSSFINFYKQYPNENKDFD